MAIEAEAAEQPNESGAAPDHGLHGGLTRNWVVATVVFVLTFLAVNVLYGFSTVRPPEPYLRTTDKVSVYISPYAINPAEDSIKAKVTVSPPDELFADSGLTRPIDVHFVSEEKTISFPVGTKTLSADLLIIANFGNYEWYPLDRYSEPMLIYSTTPLAGGGEQTLNTEAVVWGKFPGWRVIPTNSELEAPTGWWDTILGDTEAVYEDVGTESATVKVLLARNGSTMSFVAMILVAMIVLTALAMVVARAVADRRRRIEATMASWLAAMLFAMVPLRTNMPGAPPIGVWIDFLVFLWVLLGLMLALAIFVVSWLRFTPRPAPSGKQVRVDPVDPHTSD